MMGPPADHFGSKCTPGLATATGSSATDFKAKAAHEWHRLAWPLLTAEPPTPRQAISDHSGNLVATAVTRLAASILPRSPVRSRFELKSRLSLLGTEIAFILSSHAIRPVKSMIVTRVATAQDDQRHGHAVENPEQLDTRSAGS